MVQVSEEKSLNEYEAVNDENINSEFGFEDDLFEKSRLKGTKFWIIKHILHKRNKWLLFLYLALSILINSKTLTGLVASDRFLKTVRTIKFNLSTLYPQYYLQLACQLIN